MGDRKQNHIKSNQNQDCFALHLRVIVLACVINLLLISNSAQAQNQFQFSGSVIDENGRPLSDAEITIPKKGLLFVTNEKGFFSTKNITENSFDIKISMQGYKSLSMKISLLDSTYFIFRLKPTTVNLNEARVNSKHTEKKKKESSLNIEIVNDEYLKQNLGGSLMKSLERLPGVSTIDIGSGQSKPVIRGLGFNRVVVVENNIKHESQQWGADHGLEIDQYAVDNIEVIKGPASLMYGSDAIGGVIDMKNRNVPKKRTYGANIDLSGKSNNNFLGSSVSLFTRKENYFITARATILDYGDYKVPTDSVAIYSYQVPLYQNHLRNSAGKEQNFQVSFGIIKEVFQSKFYVSNVHTTGGFFANAHGLEPRNVDHSIHDASSRDILYPRHLVNHFKAINRSTYWSKKWRLELDLGYQHNNREEWSQYAQHGYMPSIFPESLDFNPEMERQFKKNVFSGNTKLFYSLSKKTELNAGINAEIKDNEIGGRGFIIPSFKQLNLGSYLITKHKHSKKSLFQAGVRYDLGKINTKSHYDWFKSPIINNEDTIYNHLQRAEDINRVFSNFTWSVGYNYNPKKWSFKINIGKSFRMPIAKELAANGVNYHRFSYEVGNVNLSPEISYQLDAGVEYNTNQFAIGATPFLNYFSNYIYLNPIANFDRLYGFGNQVFEYTQSEVFRFGGEIHAHYEIFNYLQIGFMSEFVYAQQLSGEKKGYTLPFSPPASGILNLKYLDTKLKLVKDGYVSLDYRIAATQNNIVPPEVITPGFQIFNLSFGGAINLNNQKVQISMQVQNLLNTKYFNHTSYYRLINVPEPGRNFIINLSIPIEKGFNNK